MQRSFYAPIALVLIAVLFLAVNMLSNATLYSARFDMTQDHLYTLSDGARRVLEKLNEPLRLKFYYSEHLAKDVPGAQVYGQRVRDMLKEFEAAAKGSLLLEIIDPEPFSDVEESASALGMQGISTQAGEKFFLGLAAFNMVDGQEIIPFFTQDREQFLEYDIAQLISKLSTVSKPKIGVISGLPLDLGKGGIEAVMRGEIKPFMLYQQLGEIFDVEMLSGQFASISDAINVLVIVHPKEMDAITRYAIDQYVLRGGRVIAFTDPISEVGKPASRAKNPLTDPNAVSPASGLPELYRAWGIAMDPNQIVADRGNAQRVVVDNLGQRQEAAFVAWLGLREDAMNKHDPVTGELNYIAMAMAGQIEKLPDAKTQFTPLITSSDDAALLPATMMMRRAPNPIDLLRQFQPTGQRYVLAARVTGPASTAFPKGPPPLPADAGEELATSYQAMPPHLADAAQPVNVIAVADTDLWDDNWWVQVDEFQGQKIAVPTSDNANLVIAAIENMTGAGDLISLRSRARAARPFLVVQELMRNAEARFLAEEQRLKGELQASEQRLAEMQRPEAGMPKPDGGAGENILSPEQVEEMQRAREQITQTRMALRNVQHSLRRDVEALQDNLRFINIALTPLLVGVAGIVLAQLRNHRRKRRQQLWRAAQSAGGSHAA